VNRIGDYALIGDCHSAALVGRDGSVDWACFPRFDSPAVFARVLDEGRGGFFGITPHGPSESSRAYVDDTNVLVTTFHTSTGAIEVTDCMPVSRPDVVDVIVRDQVVAQPALQRVGPVHDLVSRPLEFLRHMIK